MTNEEIKPTEKDRERAQRVFEQWVTQSRPNVLDLIQLNTRILVESFAQALAEQREADAKKCDGLVTFTENHGCNCEPCAWCEALETAAASIRNEP